MSLVLILFILILICVIFLRYGIEALENRYSNVSKKSYYIREELPNSDETADIIGKLELFIDKFVAYLDSKVPNDKRVKRLKDRLYDVKIEESPMEEDVSSYTINKGELISMCVRHKKKNKNFHDYQTLLFVLIHELAHVASISKGHNREFMTNFKFLLEHAVESKMYYAQDYSNSPITYCGVKVTNNPYYN
tara:strand:- start:661 stop:1236 length:576 start_codon:yes stop_codon:yes gene_type:complete